MKKISITSKDSKERIDRFLTRELFSSHKNASWGKYTRGEIIRNINAGNILVNGKTIKPGYILKESDELRIDIPKKKTGLVSNENIKLKIIHQDKNIIVIDKPAGLKVHPNTSAETDTLVNFLINKFPEIKNVNDGSAGAEMRPGIVHRLDKDTSGVMVVARNQKYFDALKKLFQERKIKKEYLAVVFGYLQNKKGTIEKPIARARNYKKQTIASAKTRTKIRTAVTEYIVLKESKGYSLIKVMPKTGRTHQIRVHLAHLGHPIVGDAKYEHKNYKIPVGVVRQLLHAEKIEFSLLGKDYLFQAPLPQDIALFLAGLTESA